MIETYKMGSLKATIYNRVTRKEGAPSEEPQLTGTEHTRLPMHMQQSGVTLDASDPVTDYQGIVFNHLEKQYSRAIKCMCPQGRQPGDNEQIIFFSSLTRRKPRPCFPALVIQRVSCGVEMTYEPTSYVKTELRLITHRPEHTEHKVCLTRCLSVSP